MAFKQRSAFKSKDGASAFKQIGSEDSPLKWKFGKKLLEGAKKVAGITPIGMGAKLLSKKRDSDNENDECDCPEETNGITAVTEGEGSVANLLEGETNFEKLKKEKASNRLAKNDSW